MYSISKIITWSIFKIQQNKLERISQDNKDGAKILQTTTYIKCIPGFCKKQIQVEHHVRISKCKSLLKCYVFKEEIFRSKK